MSHSPFKLLEAYDKADKEIFFGREEEVETLYQMSFQTNLMLVYGMSGTGKTSLIRCGLANRIDDSDWHPIYIRRNKDLNASFASELIAQDLEGAFEAHFTAAERLKSLYLDYLKPIYLIFDQFEELFILGTAAEYQRFAQTIAAVLAAELPVKVILVMREEYLAQLSTFEKAVPNLFDKRLRVEPMTLRNARRVIIDTLRKPEFGIRLAEEAVADIILEHITEGAGWIQLTYLQVFLDKLWRIANQQQTERPLVFDQQLLRQVGRIEDVLVGFLEEQLVVFTSEMGPRHLALKLLKIFVSEKGTKMPVTYQELQERLPEIEAQERLRLLNFFLNNRILRPLENQQFELTHDSIAYQLFKTQQVGIAMPEPEAVRFELPPFPGFRPFTREMASVFWGRDEEIRELFDLVVNKTKVRTTLVFGPLGVGKTSLVQAGLIPRLQPLFPVALLSLGQSFFHTPRLQTILNEVPQPDKRPLLMDMAFEEQLPLPGDEQRKVIILDQFEELFVWVEEHEHLSRFYAHIQQLLEPRWNIDLVLVVRDAYFAQMQDLEFYLPGMLDEQMRVNFLDPSAATEVVRQSLQIANWEVESEAIIDRIVQAAEDENQRINLTFLQLYLDKIDQSLV